MERCLNHQYGLRHTGIRCKEGRLTLVLGSMRPKRQVHRQGWVPVWAIQELGSRHFPMAALGPATDPCAASPWGVNPHMANPDGPVAANDANPQPPSPGPRTHTEGLTASGPWLLLSSAVGPPASCQGAGGVNDLTTARKKEQMAKLPLSPAGEIHTLGTRPWCRKAHKALCGVAAWNGHRRASRAL